MAMRLGERRQEVARTRGLEREPIFDVEGETDAGRGQRQPAHGRRDLRRLAADAGAGERRAARGEIGEEPAHGDRRADWPRRRLVPQYAPAAQGQPPASSGTGRRDEIELGDTGDAGQRLATEAEGAHRAEPLGRILAGGVALAGEPEIGGANAAAIVADPDEIEPATADVDAHGGRPSVERVLDQLLDHRSRSLDRLAGGDAGRDPDRQHADTAGSADALGRRRGRPSPPTIWGGTEKAVSMWVASVSTRRIQGWRAPVLPAEAKSARLAPAAENDVHIDSRRTIACCRAYRNCTERRPGTILSEARTPMSDLQSEFQRRRFRC